MSPPPIPSQRLSLPFGPRPPSGISSILRRFSTPSQYLVEEPEPAEESAFLPTMQTHDQVNDASSHTTSPMSTVHQYNLKSRGRDYAYIIVTSHARNSQDPPQLYIGEELQGYVALSLNDLSGMQSMHVVFQMFDSDPLTPSFETKRVLLSQHVDQTHVSSGIFRWPFAIAPPMTPVPSSASSSITESSHGHGTRSSPRCQLVVTISRHGRLTPNVGVRQVISYVPPPDRSVSQSTPPSATLSLPYSPPPNLSWTEQKLPSVVVRGFMFHRVHAEVECKLIIPISYPANDIIPLRLVLTSENHETLDLITVPHVINVQLMRVMAFGDGATDVRPLTLRDRRSFHDSRVVARAHWELDGHTKELFPNERHPRTRWRMKLKGELQRVPGVENLDPSFEVPGMAIMYIVRFFPFSSRDFHPTNDPKRELIMAKIELTDPAPAAGIPPASA
ncbi:hypothetical protein BC827DRAFT_1267989 [Russula dissimulans]|nr:hypothetical protein BC827DRAFT_1267989 [Russula dissimulans]